MNVIIEELKLKRKHELSQVGLTPRTNFKGTQKEHDEFHTRRAFEYERAINILSAHNIRETNKTAELRDKFMENFCDLIEKAKPLL